MVVIPAYRAEPTLRALVQAIRRLGLPVIVVDDASSDRTFWEAQEAGAVVLRRAANGGKGAALRDGLAEARRRGYEWMVTMDADGQHLPSDIPRFLDAGKKEDADLIVGNRMRDPRGMPLHRLVTNWLMSWLISRIAGQRIPDTQCGFRRVSRHFLERVPLASERFEIDSEMIIRAGWAGFRIVSVPVTCVYRRGASFIHPVGDTLRFLRFLKQLLAERRDGPRRV